MKLIITFFLLLFMPFYLSAEEVSYVYKIAFTADYFPNIDIRDARAAFAVFNENIEKHSRNVKLESYFFATPEELQKHYHTNGLDMLTCYPLDYVAGRYTDEMEPLCLGLYDDGKPGLEYAIYSCGKQLSDLKGKKLLVYHRGSQLSLMWLDVFLAKNGMPQRKKFFSEITMVAKPQNALLPVFFNQADACIADTVSFKLLCELNPQLSRKVSMISASAAMNPGIFLVKKTMEKTKREIIEKALISLFDTPGSSQILTLFQVCGITLYKPEHLKPLTDLYSEWVTLFPEEARKR